MKELTQEHYKRHILSHEELTQVMPDESEGLTVSGISDGEEVIFIGFEDHKFLMISTIHGYAYGNMEMDNTGYPTARDQFEMGFITKSQLKKYRSAKQEYEKAERERRERNTLETLKRKYEDA